MDTRRLQLALIYPNDHGRKVIAAQVDRLVESLSAIGLRTPITVRACQKYVNGQKTDAFEVVAGRHRYEAALRLKWPEIDVFIIEGDQDDASLWEIDENFARAELTDAQRADHHVRREEILVRKGLVSRGRGGDQSDKLSVRSYASEAAESLGVNRRTVERDLRRGKNIAPDVLAEVAGTDMDKGVVLDALAGLTKDNAPDADAQRAKLAEITLRRQEAERMRKEAETANRDTDRVIALTEAEQFADWLMGRCDLGEINTLIAWFEGSKPKDVIAALRRLAA
jgi:hypothetical protein